tara:strand:- start:993 stop:1217 length:225 start_codon:yes stop_codon:yes gene_type:complete
LVPVFTIFFYLKINKVNANFLVPVYSFAKHNGETRQTAPSAPVRVYVLAVRMQAQAYDTGSRAFVFSALFSFFF